MVVRLVGVSTHMSGRSVLNTLTHVHVVIVIEICGRSMFEKLANERCPLISLPTERIGRRAREICLFGGTFLRRSASTATPPRSMFDLNLFSSDESDEEEEDVSPVGHAAAPVAALPVAVQAADGSSADATDAL